LPNKHINLTSLDVYAINAMLVVIVGRHAMLDVARMKELTQGLTTKSDKIRVLSESGYNRSDIARFLGIRYQHVRNVLVQSAAKKPPGFEESGVPPIAGSPVASAAREGIRHRMSLKVDGGGRVLIPAPVREAMRVGEGDTVLAWLEDGGLHLVSPEVARRQAQELAAKLMPGAGSLADELIAERRQEARREAANG
jgi:bifunctional DNA-binding transcriptional regulator/antitoxin component of YhaV-PrlF toxin-antitoxin module